MLQGLSVEQAADFAREARDLTRNGLVAAATPGGGPVIVEREPLNRRGAADRHEGGKHRYE
jgi:hypothetical protein